MSIKSIRSRGEYPREKLACHRPASGKPFKSGRVHVKRGIASADHGPKARTLRELDLLHCQLNCRPKTKVIIRRHSVAVPKVGDTVHCEDRSNYGVITRDLSKSQYLVHFTNPKTKATALVQLHLNQLRVVRSRNAK